MGNWVRDLRYGWRMLAKNKAFTAVAILALAFGIGPNVAIFSIVWATFLAPLPYPHADQLVCVWTKVKGERNPMRADDFQQYVAQSKSFQTWDYGVWDVPMHLTGPDHEQEEISGGMGSTGAYTRTFGLHMAMGRDLLDSDAVPGNDHVVVITHRLWQERFQSDPKILGRQIRINDEPYSVVGVIEPGVADRIPGQFVVPLVLKPGGHNEHFGSTIARLKPGVTIAQAQAELSVIDQRLAATRGGGELPATAWSIGVEPLKNDWLDKKLERNLWLLLASVGFILLIACANLANLLLARGSSRQQELAVRSAMGATRGQIFTQLLTESVTLAVIGGVIGILLGWGLMTLAMSILPLATMTAEAVVGINIPVLCFAVGVTLLAGVLAGCAPALQASRLNLSEILKQNSRSVSGRGRFRVQRLLVMGEFALALTLLSGAGMALHSFWNLTQVDLGVRADHVLTGFMLPPKGPPPNAEQATANARQVIAKLESLPEVQSVALATNMPMQGHDAFPFSIAGHPVADSERPKADFESVTPSYFNTFGVQLVRGRFLSESDQPNSAPVVVVSQSFVEKYFQGMDPLDQSLLLRMYAPGKREPGPPVAFQIVGVFHSIRNGEHLNDETSPEIFAPYWQAPFPYAALAVRTSLDPGLVTKSVRSAIRSVLPAYELQDVQTMQHAIDTDLVNDRFGMVLFGGFALLALVLAALGIYGVMSFAVAQRSHEIGLRMALGAQRSDAVLLILRDGMKLAFYGIGLGIVGAVSLGFLMRRTLYGVKFVDPGSFALVAVTLLLVAVVATYVPARRSAKVDPMIALRQE